MNENDQIIYLINHMVSPEGWGRSQGREVYVKLINFIEAHPDKTIFQISLKGVKRVDFSFASETLIELSRKYRCNKGFYMTAPIDPDMIENFDAAAERKNQPLIIWRGDEYQIIGLKPAKGASEALKFALQRESVRAAEFVSANPGINIANASMKFKQLWTQGFLLRREDISGTGGVEYVYYRIK